MVSPYGFLLQKSRNSYFDGVKLFYKIEHKRLALINNFWLTQLFPSIKRY